MGQSSWTHDRVDGIQGLAASPGQVMEDESAVGGARGGSEGLALFKPDWDPGAVLVSPRCRP